MRWHLKMSSPECVVDFDIRCHGRAYEYWNGDAGRAHVLLPDLHLRRLRAVVRDGRKVEFNDHLMLNSFNRTILVKKERIDGPQYE